MMFDYYYGMDSEQFSFLRVPKLLLKDPVFKPLSAEAKILYSLMLDRLSLSQKNGWLDEQNRVYIIYSIEEIGEDFTCAPNTCVKILQELEKIGLIEKKRRGLGKANLIYVKNFISVFKQKNEEKDPKTIPFTESQNLRFKNRKNCDSRSAKIAIQESQNLRPSNTYKKETYNSNTDPINLSASEEVPAPSDEIDRIDSMCVEVENREQSEPEKDCSLETAERDFVFVTDKKKTDTTPQTSDNDKMMRVMDDIDSNRQFLKDQLHYDDNTNPEYYKDTHSDYPQFFSELFEVVCDVVCVPRKTIRVGGKPYPYDVVRSRFLKLTESDLAYVIECVKEQTGKIKNMRAYLITALYFSHESSGLHLAQKVQYDQYGKKQEEDRREQEAFEKKKQEMIEKNNRFLFGQMSEQEREEYQSSPDFTWLDFHRDREGEFDLKNGEKQYWN